MCFLSKNVAKIANSLPKYSNLPKNVKKACLGLPPWTGKWEFRQAFSFF